MPSREHGGPARPDGPVIERGETIAAVATPPGRGAVAIVRVSGDGVPAIACRLVRTQRALRPYRATVADVVDAAGGIIDRGVAILSPAPRSYTGEDVLEVHVHGNPIVVRETLEAAIAAGARLAHPGEFTRRAYENGKLDLSAASAVADLIAAQTRAAARAATANLCGALAEEMQRVRTVLFGQLETLAGAIDFPDEVADPNPDELDAALADVESSLRTLLDSAERGRLLVEGTSVAIVGPPNAGKSSLLNALLGEERALVSELPGTTRDTVEESIVVDGVPVRLIDTAGIRAHADRLEAAGIERTMRAIAQAQIVLVTVDGSRPPGDAERDVLEKTQGRTRIVFCNKSDVGSNGARALAPLEPVVGNVYDQATLAALRVAIARAGWQGEAFDATRPHLAHAYEIDAVEEALEALGRARATLAARDPVDLCAGEIARAVAALGHVGGEAVAEETIERIFARFCIGK